MRKLLFLVGTRPELIKIAPLLRLLRGDRRFQALLCTSGQHGALLEDTLAHFDIRPDISFRIQGTLAERTSACMLRFGEILEQENPDAVLVHGDTLTAFSGGLAAFYQQIPVFHIEAGLRSGNPFSPFPEEFNRVAIDCLSSVHFTPTKTDAQNLINEGRKSVFTVGNTVIDALEYSLKCKPSLPILDELEGRKLVLVTTHRRENFGDRMQSALLGIRDAIVGRDDVFVVVPVHPNPRVKAVVEEVLDNIKNIKIIEPLPMIEFHNLLSHADVILSDSGGIQEEAAYLGLPLFLLREKTERHECLSLPNTRLVGCSRQTVARELSAFLDSPSLQDKMRVPSNAFGNGDASIKIAEILLKITKKTKLKR